MRGEADSIIQELAGETWHGRSDDLLSLLANADARVRSAAAVRVGQLLTDVEVGLPEPRAVFELMRQRDAEHPGVADAFWTTVAYEYRSEDDYSQHELEQWMLSVLETRQHRRKSLSPVPGNDLEFYAHEALDRDFEALSRLLAAGYTQVVENALEHGALPPAETQTLLRALFDRSKSRAHAEPLAIHYGVVLDDARPHLPRVLFDGAPATLIAREYGALRASSAHWLFFEVPSAALASVQDAKLVSLLAAAGLPLELSHTPLDPETIRHIPFPQVDDTQRTTRIVRADLQLDLATNAQGSVTLLRVVQSRDIG